ncbi:MAG: dihydrolipoyl dehydrogenase [Planctomycetota bacterium]|nr:MAG: dihydrolipoyl dehydrogenase [Planctomycetota bacterium]
MAESYDVVIIGSGPGGYVAAIRCAQRGASVAIAEKDFIGGTCLNWGCIPSKALLSSAHTLLLAKRAALMGVDIAKATPNWPKIQARKDAIVANFRNGLTGLLQSHNITIRRGGAVVTSPKHIKLETDATPIEVEADKIILATGSQPTQIPTIPFDGKTIISSKEALGLKQIPKSMIIIGGGVIGCELACLYAAVGTKVTIVEELSRLIPMEDEWVGKLMAREFKKLDIEVLTEQEVTSADKTDGLVKVALKNGQTIKVEKVLVSVGRKAICDGRTIEGLGLEMNGPAIAVNEKMETNVTGIYAIGDVVGTTYLAHGAFAEAEVAADNATGADAKMGDYALIPRVVYTFPEVASVGKSEDVCREGGLDLAVGRAFFKANGRSVAHNETVGEIRLVRDKASDKVMGVTMVGAAVAELVAAASVLIRSTEKLTEVSFPHPTVSEVLKEAWKDAFAMSLHTPPKTSM